MAIFEDPEEAWKLTNEYDPTVDYLDIQYPIDSDMSILISDLIIKQLIDKLKIPIDLNNNASEN